MAFVVSSTKYVTVHGAEPHWTFRKECSSPSPVKLELGTHTWSGKKQKAMLKHIHTHWERERSERERGGGRGGEGEREREHACMQIKRNKMKNLSEITIVDINIKKFLESRE